MKQLEMWTDVKEFAASIEEPHAGVCVGFAISRLTKDTMTHIVAAIKASSWCVCYILKQLRGFCDLGQEEPEECIRDRVNSAPLRIRWATVTLDRLLQQQRGKMMRVAQ